MRTEFTCVERCINAKWAVTFTTYSGIPGKEHAMCNTTSAAVFATEDDAYAGAERALDMLESTGVFPNMCAAF